MFGDFGGGDLCGITTEGGLIEENRNSTGMVWFGFVY